jgi:serine/threonine protein kinase
VLGVRALFEDEGNFYLVMDLVRGLNLRKFLTDLPFEERRSKGIIYKLLEGL